MSNILTQTQIRDKYLELLKTPSFINELSQYEKDKVKEYAEKEIERAWRLADDLILSNPDKQYPEQFTNNPFDYWLSKNLGYKDANFVIKILEPETNKSTQEEKNNFHIILNSKQLFSIYDKLYPGFIDTDLKTFWEVFRGEERHSNKKIKWLIKGKNKQPNIKALLDLFYLILQKCQITITDRKLFNYINQNFVDFKENPISPKASNKSNPPKIPQSEHYLEFETLINSL